MDKQRVLAEDLNIYIDFFQKLRKAIREYKIVIDDIYNMDEVGAAIGFFYKSHIIVSEKKVAAYSLMNGNREWAPLIKCICADSIALSFFFHCSRQGVFFESYT